MIKFQRIFSGRITRVVLPFFMLALPAKQALSQSHLTSEDHDKGLHKITLALGQAHVHKGIEEAQSKWLTMSTWALNYDYRFNSTWGLGLHNDIILEDFAVEDHHNGSHNTVIERERPIATKLVGLYSPVKHVNLMLGVGDEITKSKNYFLSTVGVDYGWHLPGGFEVSAELTYDIKWHAYDTWILGAGISKLISGHHKHKG